MWGNVLEIVFIWQILLHIRNFQNRAVGLLFFLFFVYFSFSPQPPERTQMFVTSRLLEMGFSMRHIYWAMEAAGTALWSVSNIANYFTYCAFYFKHLSFTVCSNVFVVFGIQKSSFWMKKWYHRSDRRLISLRMKLLHMVEINWGCTIFFIFCSKITNTKKYQITICKY